MDAASQTASILLCPSINCRGSTQKYSETNLELITEQPQPPPSTLKRQDSKPTQVYMRTTLSNLLHDYMRRQPEYLCESCPSKHKYYSCLIYIYKLVFITRNF